MLKLGTRRSLLARAQSGWVAREVERLNPGLRVELVGIDTRGDKILDVPLSSVEGKEFFVAELDEALRSGRVDFTVHSMKDLSLSRPPEFVLACVPPRENPRDVVLFSERTRERIRAGRTIRIGTSSPRRLENLPPFLSLALPRVGGTEPKLEFVEIRGNVNTRLARVHEPEETPKHLDGVVLAFAGLIRLWADESGRAELARLLTGVRWMVMPLRENPTAAAQGALAIECKASNARVREALGRLHDPATVEQIRRERGLLEDWGGGCHQRFGCTALPVPGIEDGLFFVRGVKPDGAFFEELRWNRPARAPGEARPWDGIVGRHRKDTSPEALARPDALGEADAVFLAHSRAIELPEKDAWVRALTGRRVWTSGTASWFRLAAMGVWVEGCAESLGFEQLASTLAQSVLGLPRLASWVVLTHERGVESWEKGHGRVVATYRAPQLGEGPDSASRAALRSATHVFWGSGTQFDELRQEALPTAQHACGPGKTAAHLRRRGVRAEVFPSVEEWRKWAGI